MALRSSTHLKSMLGHLRGSSSFTTSTIPKMKAYAPTIDLAQHQSVRARAKKGEFVPVCMALGMIALSTGFGLYTAMKELRSAPDVRLKKSRRESIPEVEEPEHVLDESEKFIKKSFFRKLAHLNTKTRSEVIPNPIHGDIFSRTWRAETLKDIGVDPTPH